MARWCCGLLAEGHRGLSLHVDIAHSSPFILSPSEVETAAWLQPGKRARADARVSIGVARRSGKDSAATSRVQQILHSGSSAADVIDIEGAGPLAALDRIRKKVPSDPVERAKWREGARVAAVLGSCPRSHSSMRSG